MSRLLNRRALREEKGIPYSDTHISRLVKAGKFPAPIKAGSDHPRAHNYWFEHEIDEHNARRAAARTPTHQGASKS